MTNHGCGMPCKAGACYLALDLGRVRCAVLLRGPASLQVHTPGLLPVSPFATAVAEAPKAAACQLPLIHVAAGLGLELHTAAGAVQA
eukprot:1159623-Pelagomonas_calceolata.AAC.11